MEALEESEPITTDLNDGQGEYASDTESSAENMIF